MRTNLICAATGVAVLLAAGCKRQDNEIQTYRIAKDQPATATTNAELPAGHPDIAGGAAAMGSAPAASPLTWTTPAGWTEVPPSEMRVASFKVNADGKSADVSVIPLPGMAGSDEANVNRWRGQVGLSPVSADDLQKSAETVTVGGQPAQLYDLAGQNPASGDTTRIIGVIQHRADDEWFYKMTGDAGLVEQQKPKFIEFLKSLKFT
ncbi:MAG TPA: hypothetical protein VFV81_00325, partial [Verrucomicrobiae bacterium]|nr:hypothetical protein [Verrucomicrobiae bacterium]